MTETIDMCFRDLPENPPVGLWFHSFHEDERKTVRWHGRVVAKISDADYLVLVFDWIGDVSSLHIVTLNEMRLWQFYDTKDWWIDEYKNNLRYRNELQKKIEEEVA